MLYFLSTRFSIVSRARCESSISKAAYLSRSNLHDATTGYDYRYEGRGELNRSVILLPENVPEIYNNRQLLWTAAEENGTRSDAQTARLIRVVCPPGIPPLLFYSIIEESITTFFVEEGAAADVNFHDNEKGNLHAHAQLTMYSINADGKFGEKGYAWDNKKLPNAFRKYIADQFNDYFIDNNIDTRVFHQSFEDLMIDAIPGNHAGAAPIRKFIKDGTVNERNASYVLSFLSSISKTEVGKPGAVLTNSILDQIDAVKLYEIVNRGDGQDYLKANGPPLKKNTPAVLIEPNLSSVDLVLMPELPRLKKELIEEPTPINSPSPMTELERKIEACMREGRDLREILTPDQITQMGYAQYQSQFSKLVIDPAKVESPFELSDRLDPYDDLPEGEFPYDPLLDATEEELDELYAEHLKNKSNNDGPDIK